MESTYTVTMSIVSIEGEGGQLGGAQHEEIVVASDDDAAIEAAGFAAREWVRGRDQVDQVVYIEVWDADGRLINQDTID